MVSYGHIASPLSIPRIGLWGVVLGGTAAIAYAFTRFGLPAGAALALLPAGLCLLWVSLRNPMAAMLGMLVVNYYIMGLGRYLPTFPSGVILDAAIFYNLLILILQAFVRSVPWRQARSGLTLVAVVWTVYCALEMLNPQAVSVSGWVSSFRSVAMYFLLTVVLTQITLGRYKYLRYMLAVWSVLTLTAVAKACIQKYIGFSAAENYWLWVLGGHVTHIIYTGVRYFSFFSDAANFGAGMGFSMVVFSISALYYRNGWMRFYLLLVAAAACYGMLISGTRSALAVPFAGYAVFVLLSRNWKMVLAGIVLIIGAFVFLNFTTIGNSNGIIRRARSAFNTEDASLQVRLENQAKLRELMRDKPFGAGLGHGGGKAKQFAPDAPLSQIPTDSWFVMIWVETGVAGILLHVSILLYILGYGAWQVVFRLRDEQLRGLTAALVAGISGVVVMSYANEVFGQIPTGAIIYMCMGFIFLSPRFDREIAAAKLSGGDTAPAKGRIGRNRAALPVPARPTAGSAATGSSAAGSSTTGMRAERSAASSTAADADGGKPFTARYGESGGTHHLSDGNRTGHVAGNGPHVSERCAALSAVGTDTGKAFGDERFSDKRRSASAAGHGAGEDGGSDRRNPDEKNSAAAGPDTGHPSADARSERAFADKGLAAPEKYTDPHSEDEARAGHPSADARSERAFADKGLAAPEKYTDPRSEDEARAGNPSADASFPEP